MISYLLVMALSLIAQDIPRTLYVLNGLGQTVSKMDLEKEIIVNNIAVVGSVPNRIYAYGNLIYVVNSIPDGISIIDPVSNRVIDNITLTTGSNPYDMAFVGANKAYVTNLKANSVTVLDLNSGEEVNSINVGTGPQGLLIVNNTAYVCNTGGFPNYAPATISVINIETDSVTKTIGVPANPQDLALAPNGKIYLVCTGNYNNISGKIMEIDPFGDLDYTAVIMDTIDIGGNPTDIIVTNSGMAYLADFGDGSNGFVYAYDIFNRQVLHDAGNPILVGYGALALLYDSQYNALYVNNFSDDAVQLLNPADGSVVKTYLFGDGAQHFTILEEIKASDPWADDVVSYVPGAMAGFGQNYYPSNVLGPPDPDPLINAYNPSSKPQEILSLGQGGEIILEFSDNYIINGDGPDFTVFENAFYFSGTQDPFIEAAFVAASADGKTWFEFPWDTSSFAGFAGVTPTFNTQYPTDPALSGGDQFDLASVGLPFARFIKLTDLGDLKKEGLFNGDFDLDAVVAINTRPGQPSTIEEGQVTLPERFALKQNYPNPFNATTVISWQSAGGSNVELSIFNLQGQKIETLVSGWQPAGFYHVEWNAGGYASGVYFYCLKTTDGLIATRKLILLK